MSTEGGAVALTIRLLGPPAIARDGVPAPPPRGRKAWALLAYLLLADRPPSRRHLAELLFGDADDPLGALRWTLAELRRALGTRELFGGDPVATALGGGSRSTSRCWRASRPTRPRWPRPGCWRVASTTPPSPACSTAYRQNRTPPDPWCWFRGRQPWWALIALGGSAAARGGGGGRPAAPWPTRPGRAVRPGGPAPPGRSATACSSTSFFKDVRASPKPRDPKGDQSVSTVMRERLWGRSTRRAVRSTRAACAFSACSASLP